MDLHSHSLGGAVQGNKVPPLPRSHQSPLLLCQDRGQAEQPEDLRLSVTHEEIKVLLGVRIGVSTED